MTAVVPDALDRAGGMLPAGLFVGNGFGKLTGATQLAELGDDRDAGRADRDAVRVPRGRRLGDVPAAAAGQRGHAHRQPGRRRDQRRVPVRHQGQAVTERHVLAAICGARGGPVGEGAVGAGTGTSALGFKAGIGTASRLVTPAGSGGLAGSTGAIGVLVQSNFSGVLTVRGVRIGAPGHGGEPAGGDERQGGDRAGGAADGGGQDGGPRGNSCMIVVATDHGLDSRQLGRVARRAVFAMGRTGADFAGTSGDYAIAFAAGGGPPVPDARSARSSRPCRTRSRRRS